MRFAGRAALAAALLAVAGCSSWNPLVAIGLKSEPAHKPTPLTPIEATVTPNAVWTAKVGKSAGLGLRPQADGGRVYAAAADGSVTVLDAETGKQVSRAETNTKVSGGVTLASGLVIVGTLKGEVWALQPSGATAWSTLVAGEVIAPPATSREVVVVRTADGRIFGLSSKDGHRLWVFQRATPALLLRSEAGVLAVGTDVVAGYPNGKLIALDLEDGKLTWEVTVSQPRGTTELERIADVAGLPVLDGNNVCAGAFQGKVACFDIKTRNMLWSKDLSTAEDLANDAKRLYVTDDTGAVQALDKASGANVWKQDKLAWRHVTAPLVVADRIVVGDGQGYVHVLSGEDGAIVGRLATDGTAVESLVAAPGGGFLVQTAGGTVSLVRF